MAGSRIEATVLYVDRYGNVQVNLDREDMDQIEIAPGTRVELDCKGEHYFAWVQSNGWEYVLPTTGGGVRNVYAAVDKTTAEDGSTRPTSAVYATCALVSSP